MVRIGALRLCPSKMIKPDPTLMPSLDPSVLRGESFEGLPVDSKVLAGVSKKI